MCMLNKRTHILFDQSLWQTLTDLSVAKKVSVGQLVRNAVEEKYLKDQDLSSRAKAIDRILTLKKQYKTKTIKRESVVELVKRMREERTEHIWNLVEENRKKTK